MTMGCLPIIALSMVSYAASMARGRMSCQSFAIGSNPITVFPHRSLRKGDERKIECSD